MLGGIYVIKILINKEEMSPKVYVSVYKNLSCIEWTFKMMKSGGIKI